MCSSDLTMGAAASSCVVVEDSVAGVEAALAAGMHVFAYTGSVTPAASLLQPGVTVFEDMAMLPALIQNISR